MIDSEEEECFGPVEIEHLMAHHKHRLNPPVMWIQVEAMQAVEETLLCLKNMH